MPITVTASEASAKLLTLLDEVAAGEEIAITVRGTTVARLVPVTNAHALKNAFAGVATTACTDEELFTAASDWNAS